MITLWDILRPLTSALLGPPASAAPVRKRSAAPTRRQRAKRPTRQDRYETVKADMLARYGVRVRRWRKSLSGLAWQVEYRDGRIQRLIESPEPKTPLSMAIFLHEIGHHAIGLARHKPRCLEEYLAWKFSLDQMEALGLPVTDRVRQRVHRSLRYAVSKARRRGLRELPPELLPYAEPA